MYNKDLKAQYGNFLSKIAELVRGQADFSEKDQRVYVKFIGISKVNVLKSFMSKHGFNYVYGAYDEGVYELGFSKGEGI